MWWKSLIGLIRKFLRIICLFVFLHWITWRTTYATCNNYRDSINKVEDHEEVKNIEESILGQIEKKINKEIPLSQYKWKNGDWSNKLKGLKDEKKIKEYNDKLENCKKITISNIEEQLKNNDLSITELDDGRTLFQRFWNDPLKFFLVSPLNKISKKLELSKTSLWAEIFFKLAAVKLLYMLVIYPEVNLESLQENSTKLQDPSLSLEEKEQISKDFSPWPMIFNMMVASLLFIIFTPLHPSFLDQTNPAYSQQTNFFYWLPFIILVGVFSNISGEFARQKRVLKTKEIKIYLVKNWVVSLIAAPLFQFILSLFFGRNYGGYLFSICSGLVEFILNMVKVVFFRGKDGKTPSSTNTFRKNHKKS